MQNNIKWNYFIARGSWDGIRKAFDKRTGTIADINLGLVAALNFAGVNADAVLVSTRDNGIVSKLSPVVDEFNYVIVKTSIGGKTYLLDATDPLLSFGLLPLRCLNDQGRVISLNKPSYWIDINKQNASTTSTLNFTLTDNGKLKGVIKNYLIGYSAYTKRKAIKEFSSKEEYIEDFDEKRPRLKVLSGSISNLDSLDLPLTETYEVEIDVYDKLGDGKLTFNPFLFNRLMVNPYKLADRSYPVDRGMASNERVTLTVQLPEKYSVENPPKNLNIGLPDGGGKFVTNFDADKNVFTFSHAIVLNKAIYMPGEYPYLKELFNQIILSEKVDLVFKKN
ncbi:MAG: hypothetical protein EOP47_25630 [Sphingobacteriaceae bacterium]|nr:MAG: hypothetical protein EOP47_25630 [Sphingobacteriaceae bacterium]